MRLAALGLVVLLLGGCVGLASSLEAAGRDTAVLCGSYIGPWGTIVVSRSNIQHGQLRCRPDGHEVSDLSTGAPTKAPGSAPADRRTP